MFRASRSQGEATERPVCVGYFGPVGRTAAWTGARRGSGPACGPPGGTDSRRGDPMRRRGRLLDQVAAAMRRRGRLLEQVHAVGACPRAA